MPDNTQEQAELKQTKLREDRVIGEALTNKLPSFVAMVRTIMSDNPKLTADEATEELVATLEKLNASTS